MCEFRVTDGGDGISELVSRRCPCLEVLELERIEGVEALTLITDSLQRLRLIKFKTFLEQLQVKQETSARCRCSTAYSRAAAGGSAGRCGSTRRSWRSLFGKTSVPTRSG
ncbi:hypothetical protein GUJ93_ZPchr0007g6414 [Zizania palustris]|uniref:FBD domain-containing protein n=1 Tax=Zizania palustris TaxID=103762 RepID=A0A8J5TFU5_ZIZPA|nr:hypothetical protein GUJ93_ZPchr0007g6414 [Zizania palustris]